MNRKKMLTGNLDYTFHIEDGLAFFPVLPLTLETLVEGVTAVLVQKQ